MHQLNMTRVICVGCRVLLAGNAIRCFFPFAVNIAIVKVALTQCFPAFTTACKARYR